MYARRPYNSQLSRPRHSGHVRRVLVYKRKIPVCGREAAKGAYEGKEDDEKDDVGTEGAYEEDEADETCRNTSQLPRLT